MLQWHGRNGAGAIDDEAAAADTFEVVLYGTPLCADDAPLIHARLADDDWALATARAALVYGLCRGRGQLWLPDEQARVTALRGDADSRDGLMRQRQLRVHTRLPREALAERLLDAFSDDRYIDARVLERAPAAHEPAGNRRARKASLDNAF